MSAMKVEYEQVRQAVIELLAQEDQDEVCVASTTRSWTWQELTQAVRSGSYKGIFNLI